MSLWEERKESHSQQREDARSAYDADYARIIHSASFRRLQGKTQILNIGDSDFYRTRLTHTLEVSQIATGIVRQLSKDLGEHPAKGILPDDTLIQAICLTHDLGHPPFGHGGEVALNYCVKDHGGFEGNGQTLRILTKLEHYSANAGANLTRRTLLGGLKYPASYSSTKNKKIIPTLNNDDAITKTINRGSCKPPKCYLDCEQAEVDWIFQEIDDHEKATFFEIEENEGKHSKAKHKSFDCTIMDVADDIAYGVHDLEDSISLKLVTEDQFRADVLESHCPKFLDKLKEKYPDEFGNNVYDVFVKKLFSDSATRKRQISRMVHHFITNIEIYELADFSTPLLKYRVRIKPENRGYLDALQKFVANRVIKSPSVQHLEFKGQCMVIAVFEVLASEPKSFLPLDSHERYKESGEDKRVICDYIAGMTDHFLLKTYDRLFSPRMGSVFDKL
ncbi:MAG: anti-phage deoxyguanosine triphosphatase [Pseudobdellovibrionaceae bacterium]